MPITAAGQVDAYCAGCVHRDGAYGNVELEPRGEEPVEAPEPVDVLVPVEGPESVEMPASVETPESVEGPESAGTCLPDLLLKNVSEGGFNPSNTPFAIELSCSELNATGHAVLARTPSDGDPFGTAVEVSLLADAPKSIVVAGLGSGVYVLNVFAASTSGAVVFKTFSLVFGDIAMPVLVLGVDRAPASGIEVVAEATTQPGITQTKTTDSEGIVEFTSLLATTISIFARSSDNAIGLDGVAASPSPVTIYLIRFKPASDATDLAVDNGLSGWTGGSIVLGAPTDASEASVPTSRRLLQEPIQDSVLVVQTAGQEQLQSASAQPRIYPFTKSVFIRYRFQTA